MVHMLLSMDNMHGILRQLYTDMMTLCEGMTSVASGIAGLGALLYISYRVWQSLARGEAIDLFPLLRPFALGICIMFFPTLVLGSLNGILSPVVQATHSLMVGQTFNIERYMEQREALEREERERLPADSYPKWSASSTPWGWTSRRAAPSTRWTKNAPRGRSRAG